MTTVAVEGQFRFVVNTREDAFEPPHVHVWVGNEDVCRIELNGGAYMDQPPLATSGTSCRHTRDTRQRSGRPGTLSTGGSRWIRFW